VVGDLGLQYRDGVLKEGESFFLTVATEEEEREKNFSLGDHVVVAGVVNTFEDGERFAEGGFTLIKLLLRLKAGSKVDVADSDGGVLLGAEDLLINVDRVL